MSTKIQTKADKSVFQMVPKKTRDAAKALYESSSFFDKTTKKEIDFLKDKLVQHKHVQELKALIDLIYPTSKYVPTQLQEANDDLIDGGTIVRYFPRDHQKSKEQLMLAFVVREYRNSYRIFINEDCEDESFDSMDLHEKGHVLFNHTQSVNLYIEQFRKELELIWDTKLAKYFEDAVNKNPNNKTKIVKMLFIEFANIAQDMEINSKLFDNGEWIKAKKTMTRSGIIVHHKDLLKEFDDLSGLIKDPKGRMIDSSVYKKIATKFGFILDNIKNRIAGEEGDFQFCYPANKGWPEKLDWMTYMILLVKNLDDTMQQVMKQIGDKLAGKGLPTGNSGGPGNDSNNGQNQNGGKKISQDVLDDYANETGKEDDAENDANGGMMGDDEDDGDEDGEGAGGATGRNRGGNNRGRGHGGIKVEFETCDTFDSFTKFLRKTCLGKKNRRLNSDVLYNSNRGKFASRVVVPRRHLIEKWMPTECHIIVDVSGSVPTDYVERVINSIIDTNSGIDLKNSHIIFCDTHVVSDEIMSARTKSVYAGGGTEIANGIRYVKEKGYCKKKTDKLFVISDFEDDLNNWVEAARDLPGIKYAIGYNVNSEKDCERKFEHSSGRNGNENEFKNAWNNTFKTIFIVEQIRN